MVAQLYAADRFITVGVVVNIAVLFALMIATVRSVRGEEDTSALVSSSAAAPSAGHPMPDTYALRRP